MKIGYKNAFAKFEIDDNFDINYMVSIELASCSGQYSMDYFSRKKILKITIHLIKILIKSLYIIPIKRFKLKN